MQLVVLDTNIFVAAGFNPRSHSARVVAAVRAGDLGMAWSAATRDEVAHVLGRIPRRSWEEAAGLFRPADEVRGPLDLARFVAVPDPADRPFAALAAAADATLLSNDEHLLGHAPALGVRVQTPGDFWRMWRAKR